MVLSHIDFFFLFPLSLTLFLNINKYILGLGLKQKKRAIPILHIASASKKCNKSSFDYILLLRNDKLHNYIQRGIFDFSGLANCFPFPVLSEDLL